MTYVRFSQTRTFVRFDTRRTYVKFGGLVSVPPTLTDVLTLLSTLPIYETDDEAIADLSPGDYFWLDPADDVGQNRTLKRIPPA